MEINNINNIQPFKNISTFSELMLNENIINMFDLDHDGKLSADEIAKLEKLISSFGTNIASASNDDIQNFIKMLDSDGDGNLSAEDTEKAQKIFGSLDGKNGFSNSDMDILKGYIDYLTQEKGISEDKIIEYIKGLDGNSENLSASDLKKIKEEYEQYANPENLATNEDLEAKETKYENDVKNGTSNGTYKSAQTEKTLDNMSVSELENALKTANEDIITKTSALNSVINESTPELMTAKEELNMSFTNYVDTLKTVDSDLALQMRTVKSQIDDKQSEINENDTQINNCNRNISENDTQINLTNSQISSYESAIAALETQKSNETDNNNSKIEVRIAELKAAKETLENKLPELESKKEEYEAQLTDLNKQKTSLSESLNSLNTTMAALNLKATEIAQQDESGVIRAAKNTYDTAQTNFSQLKQDKKAEAETDLATIQKSEEEIRTKLEARKTQQIKAKGSIVLGNSDGPDNMRGMDDYSNLPTTYELDGETFNCIGFTGYDTDGDGKIDFQIDSMEQMQSFMLNAGLTNTGKYGAKQCHNYSNVFVDIALGSVNRKLFDAAYDEYTGNIGNEDKAGKMGTQREYNSRDCIRCEADNRDEERAIIENELKNGRPCLVSVPSSSGQHWVVACGISDNGDILIWDSYNSKCEILGRSSNSDKNSRHRNMATANGVMVFVEGSSYQYSTRDTIDYWSDYVGYNADYANARTKKRV